MATSKVFVEAQVTLYPDKVVQFMALMPLLAVALAPHHWVLIGAYSLATGPVRTYVNLWQVPDANSLLTLGAIINSDPALKELYGNVLSCIQSETHALWTSAPYAPAIQIVDKEKSS